GVVRRCHAPAWCGRLVRAAGPSRHHAGVRVATRRHAPWPGWIRDGTAVKNAKLGLLAALATLLTASAFWPVFVDAGWVPVTVGAVLLVTATGAVVRRLRFALVLEPLFAVGMLLAYATFVFTTAAFAGGIPDGHARQALRTL